ncbi:hypothetical protein RN001_014847 [Aquatica leii]|uniref:Amino acid transporter transmembrane domain-containing protein n=1 Tax=Aquatica leii TaxID=1421715 RepID=A0AAN7SKT3_9COLE|nr:hypothetical protein RN001_014847 [Aquatica leii]
MTIKQKFIDCATIEHNMALKPTIIFDATVVSERYINEVREWEAMQEETLNTHCASVLVRLEAYRNQHYLFTMPNSFKQHDNPVFICDDESYAEKYSSNSDTISDSADLASTLELTDSYEPYDHRNVSHPTTNWETLFHLLRGCMGTGILAMPKAFSYAGYCLGTVATLVIGFFCAYSIHLLVKAEYELCKRKKIPSLTYTRIAVEAFSEGPKCLRGFAPYSGIMVNVLLLIYQLGGCSVYIVFIAFNVKAVVGTYITDIRIEYYMLMLLPPLIFVNWIKNLKKLAPLSIFANFITLISFVIILYYIITIKPTFENRKMIGDVTNFPLFFGTVLYALEGVAVIIPLENEMKTPKSFKGVFGVLSKGMLIIVLLYASLGLFGYLTFGKDVEGSITLSLPDEEVLAQLVKLGLAFSIFLTYPIQFYPPIDIIWIQYLGPKLKNDSMKTFWELTLRTVLVFLTFILAVAVPSLDLCISLLGAFCLSTVGIAIPALIDTVTFWNCKTGWRFYLMFIKNLILIVFGVGGLISGTYTNNKILIQMVSVPEESTSFLTMLDKTKEHDNPVFVCDNGSYVEKYSSNSDISSNKLTHSVDLNSSSELRDGYEPYDHREVSHPTTNWETLFHLLKGCLGTGILAMPKAFSHAGYVLGTVGTLVIGFFCTYCIHLLVKAEYELCKRKKIPSLTYTRIAEEAFSEGPRCLRGFAPYSGIMVNVFLLIYQLGACCVYIVFIAFNIQAVAGVYVSGIRIEYYMLMFLLPLILMNWIRNLKKLAPLSTFANFITLISFIIILYYIVITKPTFKGREMVSDATNFPLFFGTVLFALEAVGVIIPLENEMKTPKSFKGVFGVLNKGMVIIVSLYTGLGLLGYLAFGKKTEGSITLNLPDKEILAQVVKSSLALAIFLTYPIQYYVAIDITWIQYLGPKLENNSMRTLWELTLRTVLVLLTFILAVAVPALDLFISLFGAFCLSAVGIAIPALIDTLTFWNYKTGWRFHLMFAKNLILIIFGVGGLIAGTYTTRAGVSFFSLPTCGDHQIVWI